MAARKRFGQHFLEPAWVAKVVDAIRPTSDQEFIEIGPGRAALTIPLAASAKHVTAFEIDRDLVRALRAAAPGNLTVVEGDFLTSAWFRENPLLQPVRVAGNLPYNVATPILFKLIDLFQDGMPIVDATLMVQREVADRLLARPSTKEYGVLTVLVGLSADVEPLLKLPPGAFRPMPKVNSALIRLRFHEPNPQPADQWQFERMVTALFTRRRKTVSNALQAFRPDDVDAVTSALREAHIDRERRPETLTIGELVQLSGALSKIPAPS